MVTMKLLNKGSRIALLLSILSTLFLSSCNFIYQEDIKSHILTEKKDELGEDVGIIWKDTQATNLSMALRGGNWDSEEIADICVIKRDDEYYMWYSGRGPFGVVSGEHNPSLWRIGFAKSKNGIHWEKDYVNNPVLLPGENECLDRKGARLISVLYDEAERVYKMWYRGHDGNSLSIFYATSKNPNKGWIKSPNDTLENGRNPEPVFRLKTLRHVSSKPDTPATEFTDKFTLKNHVTDSTSDITIVTTTKSTQASSGVNFTDIAYNFNYEGSGTVVKEVNNITATIKRDVYKMWYVVKERNKYIIKFAYSFSGTNWFTDLNTTSVFKEQVHPFCEEGAVMPTIIPDLYENKMIYKMWFTGVKGTDRTLGIAYCKGDGSKFNYKKTSPIMDKGNIPEDALGISSVNIIRNGNAYMMWYIGKGEDNVYRVCYRKSE